MAINFRLPPLSQFRRDVQLIIISTGIFSVSFFGIQTLLKVLYVLRLGYGVEYVGLFSATGALTYMAMSLPSGALGSRFGTQKVMFAGGVITVVGMAILPLMEFMPGWLQDSWGIGSQIVSSAGWAMMGVNQVPALMAATTAQNRNSAYALNSVLRGLGTFVGTIVGGLLPGLFAFLLSQPVEMPLTYRLALWVGAALGVIGLVPLGMMKQAEPVVLEKKEEAAGGPFPMLPIGLLLVYVYLSHAGWATCQAFCNAYMDTDLQLSAASIGLITGAGQLVAIGAPLLGPRLAMRYSNGWTLMVSTLIIGVSLAPVALIPHWSAAGLGRLGTVALAGIWLPALQVFQMELVESRWRSLAYGALSMAMGLSFGTISLAGGYIVAGWDYSSLFLLGMGLNLAGAVLMWGILKVPAIRMLSAELR